MATHVQQWQPERLHCPLVRVFGSLHCGIIVCNRWTRPPGHTRCAHGSPPRKLLMTFFKIAGNGILLAFPCSQISMDVQGKGRTYHSPENACIIDGIEQSFVNNNTMYALVSRPFLSFHFLSSPLRVPFVSVRAVSCRAVPCHAVLQHSTPKLAAHPLINARLEPDFRGRRRIELCAAERVGVSVENQAIEGRTVNDTARR